MGLAYPSSPAQDDGSKKVGVWTRLLPRIEREHERVMDLLRGLPNNELTDDRRELMRYITWLQRGHALAHEEGQCHVDHPLPEPRPS